MIEINAFTWIKPNQSILVTTERGKREVIN
jgi:hypothetical protein